MEGIATLIFNILKRRYPEFNNLSLDRRGELTMELENIINRWIEKKHKEG